MTVLLHALRALGWLGAVLLLVLGVYAAWLGDAPLAFVEGMLGGIAIFAAAELAP